MNVLALSLTPSISSNKPFLIKGLLWRGRGRYLKSEWKCSICEKNRMIFQIEFLLISWLVVPESLWKRRRHFFKLFFIYEHVNISIVIIVYVSIFSLLLDFSFKKIHKHPACKMNRDEQGGAGRIFEVLNEHTFWMTPKSFCCD